MPDSTLSDLVAAAITRRRKALGLNREQLAEACQRAGAPSTGSRALTAATIANIETGRPDAAGRRRRDITVEELSAFAAALKIAEPWSLTVPPACETCQGAPPPGFACLDCGSPMRHANPAPQAPPLIQVAARPRRRTLTPAILNDVAQIYRSAMTAGNPPTMAVAECFGIAHRTAARWVAAARTAGSLGPALGPTAGEVPSDLVREEP